MKNLILAVAVLAVAGISSVSRADYTHGYFRGNGNYVQPYYHSHPDGNPYNNWGGLSRLETNELKSPLNPVSFSPFQIG